MISNRFEVSSNSTHALRHDFIYYTKHLEDSRFIGYKEQISEIPNMQDFDCSEFIVAIKNNGFMRNTSNSNPVFIESKTNTGY